MNWTDVIEKCVYAGAGALASLGVAYVAIVRELAFIKGSMATWTEAVAKITRMDERQNKFDLEMQRQKDEIEAMKPPCDMAN